MADTAEVEVVFGAQTEGLDRGILTAKTSLKDLRAAISGSTEPAAPAAQKAGEAMRGLSVHTAGATREFIVLGHEVLSGNFSRIPGSLMVLGERMGGLRLATVGYAAAVAAVGYSMYEMVSGAEDSAEAMNLIKNRLELTGRGYLDNDKNINQLIDTLRQIPGVSKASAEAMVADMAGAGRLTSEQMTFLTQNVGKYAEASGVTVPQAMKTLSSALEEPFAAYKKLDEQLNLLSPAQFQHIKNLESEGEKGKAAAVVQQALADRLAAVIVQMTPLQTAAHDLGAAWDSLMESFSNVKWLNWITETALPKLLSLLKETLLGVEELTSGLSGGALSVKSGAVEGKSAPEEKQKIYNQDELNPQDSAGAEQEAVEQQHLKDTQAAREKASKEALQMKAQELSGMRTYDDAYYTGEAEKIKLAADMKKITGTEEYAELQANLNKQQAAVMKTFDDQIALYDKDSKEFAKLQQEKTLAAQKFANQQTQLQIQQVNAQQQADNKMAADWKSMTSGMQSGLTSAITGMITGTKTFGQAVVQLMTSMVSMVVGKFVEIGIQWAGVQLGMLPETKATALSNITASAGEAFSAAYASICAIPIVGPGLAPAAAAEAGGAALSGGVAMAAFAVGTPNVPADMIAQIHKGEAIVPQKTAQAWRDGDLGVGGGGGPDVHFHVNAMDAKSVKQFFSQHGAMLAKTMQGHIRNGGRGAFA
jgi:hypothetical protein